MLSIDPQLFALTVVVFLTLIFVLNRVLYRPILSFIDRRNEMIAKDESDLRQRGDDAQAYKKEADEILNAARIDAAKFKDEAVAKATKEAGALVASQKAALESEFKAFLSELGAQTDELKSDLRARLPEFRNSLKTAVSRLS